MGLYAYFGQFLSKHSPLWLLGMCFSSTMTIILNLPILRVTIVPQLLAKLKKSSYNSWTIILYIIRIILVNIYCFLLGQYLNEREIRWYRVIFCAFTESHENSDLGSTDPPVQSWTWAQTFSLYFRGKNYPY